MLDRAYNVKLHAVGKIDIEDKLSYPQVTDSQQMSNLQSQPSTTVFFCVESGHFEAQTLLAIECLRHFGGRFANVPVLAITPRLGPSLTRETLRRFDELGVTYIRQDLGHRYSWFGFTNKVLAAMLAEEYASTEQIIWMDSDTLVVEEPELLWLEPDIDFAICSVDKNVGTSGPDDKNEPYWLALSKYYNIDINRLPWVITEFDRQRVRFRLHSGIYAFRRGSGLGKGWLKASEQMFDSHIVYSKEVPFPGDDIALAFGVVEMNLRWRLFPMSYNYEMTPTSSIYKHEELHSAIILHYHYVITQTDSCTWLLKELQSELPDVYNWLKERVPLNPKIGGFHRALVRRCLQEWRVRKYKQFAANSQYFA